MNTRPVPNAYLRVSDAERQQVADVLKQHATDGRLDQAEFEERLDRTLRAKTRADLSGLFDDLPRLDSEPEPVYGPAGYGSAGYGPAGPGPAGYGGGGYGPPGSGPWPRDRDVPRYGRRGDRPARGDGGALRPILRALFMVAAVLFALSLVAHAVQFHVAWLIVFGVVAVAWYRHRAWHRGRC